MMSNIKVGDKVRFLNSTGGGVVRSFKGKDQVLVEDEDGFEGHKDYYPRFGYKQAIDFGIEFPFDVPHEYCMAIELRPKSLKDVQGMIQYAKPFTE